MTTPEERHAHRVRVLRLAQADLRQQAAALHRMLVSYDTAPTCEGLRDNLRAVQTVTDRMGEFAEGAIQSDIYAAAREGA